MLTGLSYTAGATSTALMPQIGRSCTVMKTEPCVFVFAEPCPGPAADRGNKKRKLPNDQDAPGMQAAAVATDSKAAGGGGAVAARSSISFACDHVLISQTVPLPETSSCMSISDACMTAHDQTATRCMRYARNCPFIDIDSRCCSLCLLTLY